MKFLLFNAAVIAALVYLFNADRSDFRNAADRLYDTAEGAGEMTRRVVSKIEEAPPLAASASRQGRVHGKAPVESAPAPAPAPKPQAVMSPNPEASPATGTAPAPATRPAPAASTGAKAVSKQAPAPVPLMPARAKPAAQQPAAPDLAKASPPQSIPPAVEQRRKEVLEGLPAGEGGAAVALAEGEELMSPEQRVRELYSLAEEMEMLYVNKMAR